MRLIDKMERKFGRFAIPNLMLYLVLMYVTGLFIYFVNPAFYFKYLCLNAEAILHGEIWRIITYLIYPPTVNPFLFLILCLVYVSIGRLAEQLMGTFRFNLYLFMGIIGNVLAAIIIYLVSGAILPLTADELYMSVFLAIAVTIPEMKFYLYGILPIKAKWLGLIYGAMLLYQITVGSWVVRVALIMSLLNFIIYFILLRKPVQQAKQAKRKVVYQAQARPRTDVPRHRCAVCGRTEKDDPSLEFRYCSKCEGGQEYCMDHLYTHVHVTKELENHEKN